MIYLKFITNKLPTQVAAYDAVTYGPIIFIKKSHKDNSGLLEHEKFHTTMFWTHIVIMFAAALLLYYTLFPYQTVLYAGLFAGTVSRALLYKYNARYRLWEEIIAYSIQYKTNGETITKLHYYATQISTHYGIKTVSTQEIFKKLLNESQIK